MKCFAEANYCFPLFCKTWTFLLKTYTFACTRAHSVWTVRDATKRKKNWRNSMLQSRYKSKCLRFSTLSSCTLEWETENFSEEMSSSAPTFLHNSHSFSFIDVFHLKFFLHFKNVTYNICKCKNTHTRMKTLLGQILNRSKENFLLFLYYLFWIYRAREEEKKKQIWKIDFKWRNKQKPTFLQQNRKFERNEQTVNAKEREVIFFLCIRTFWCTLIKIYMSLENNPGISTS